MAQEQLDGGNIGAAVRVGDTVRRGWSLDAGRARPAHAPGADDTLDQVARWMRAYHQAVAGFVVKAHANGMRDLAAAGDEVFGQLLRQGVAGDLDQAIAELASFP